MATAEKISLLTVYAGDYVDVYIDDAKKCRIEKVQGLNLQMILATAFATNQFTGQKVTVFEVDAQTFEILEFDTENKILKAKTVKKVSIWRDKR
ncbi:MAG TPA: hypothetical protein VJJ80_01710 [Patescibacteria group bacterium]|nr:hypothetical protein [Patescibacteria group bacterium]